MQVGFTEKIKVLVWNRAAGRCCICHKPFIEVHHIMPEHGEGDRDNSFENAAPLCAGCHDLYGDNPSKRKQIKRFRDMWYGEIEKKRKGGLEKLFEEYQETDSKLRMGSSNGRR